MFEKEVFEFPPPSVDLLLLTDSEWEMVGISGEGAESGPPRWDEIGPGPFLGALLSTIDIGQTTATDLIGLLQAYQKMASHFEAKVLESVASLSDAMLEDCGHDYELAHEATALEIRAALRMTRRSASNRIAFADQVFRRLPRVGRALAGGQIDVPRARILSDGTAHLDESEAGQVVDKLIETAHQSTTGQLAAKVRALGMAVDAGAAENRYQTAVEGRHVFREPTVDGTANLMILDAPPNRVGEALNLINHIARSLLAPGESRTLDQIRVDVALDLLTGQGDRRRTGRGTVNIHVDLETLGELADRPGELAGFGPVVADIARQVVAEQNESEWRFRVTDPTTGMPIHVGTTRRRPSADQERRVEIRDLTCVFPGCRMPANDCDIDHIQPWSETGRTRVDSLAPICRHDHVGRHEFGWTYQPIPGGDYLWTSHLGHRYTTSGRAPPA